MAAPLLLTLPPVRDKSRMVTVLPLLMWNTRLTLLPLTMIVLPLVFVIVTLWVMLSSPVVSVIVWGPAPAILKSIVLPVQADEIASRSEPPPLSLVFVTIGLTVQGLTVCETLPLLVSKLPSPL